MSANIFPSGLAPNTPNSISRNPSLCFCVVLNCLSNAFYQYSRIVGRLNYFPFFLFDIINVAVLESEVLHFLMISYICCCYMLLLLILRISTRLCSTTWVRYGPRSQPRNLSNCTMLDSLVFDNFIFTKKLFAKSLQRFKTWRLVKSKLCAKLVSLISIIFDDSLRVIYGN